MKNFLKKIFTKEFITPGDRGLRNLTRNFSPTEKVLFSLFVIVFGLSTLFLVWNVNQSFLVEIPASGGALVEGIVGTPRFINPVLAQGDADRDLSALVYSGLLKGEEGGRLVPDLATSYAISDDGLVYTFMLRDDIFFHDGTPVTTDDVEFTVQKAQDAAIKSPKRANWDGIVIEKVGPKQIRFLLKSPYAPFIENTTLGILPKHIWKNVDADQFAFSQFNIEPLGSGPFEVSNIRRNSGGLPQYYEFMPFKHYALGKPYITHLTIKFFSNEKALITAYESGDIESLNSLTPSEASVLEEKGARVETSPLPRVFGVFFNQNQKVLFANAAVREALNIVIPRARIVQEVLKGYGTEIDGPIPPGGILGSTHEVVDENMDDVTRREKALATLTNDGWKKNERGMMERTTKTGTEMLSFSLSTSNAPELKNAAEILREEWAKLGAEVSVKVFETGDLNQTIIRPRKYDALLFGEIIGRDLDLFAFWHSSQRNDPGLNIALYVNSKADKLLTEARTLSDPHERVLRYEKLEEMIRADVPAAFTYSPDFIYIIPEKIKGFSLGQITTPGDRFMNIHHWYINTDKVWKVFVKNEEASEPSTTNNN